ncbi:hypothetical protein Nmel_000091, partial [Mimus melanotis]
GLPQPTTGIKEASAPSDCSVCALPQRTPCPVPQSVMNLLLASWRR